MRINKAHFSIAREYISFHLKDVGQMEEKIVEKVFTKQRKHRRED